MFGHVRVLNTRFSRSFFGGDEWQDGGFHSGAEEKNGNLSHFRMIEDVIVVRNGLIPTDKLARWDRIFSC